MANKDDLYFSIIFEIINVLERIRVRGEFRDPNFLPGKGESIHSAFLRAIGFIRYSTEIEERIALTQQVERGQTVVDRLLKPKTQEAEDRRAIFTSFLKALLAQLEKYIRDTNLSQIKRIRKLIGSPVSNPRTDSRQGTVDFTGNIANDIRLVNEQLQRYDQQRAGIGQLVQEIDLLSNFTGTLSALIRSLFQPSVTTPSVGPDPLSEIGGSFISLIKAQTVGYIQRLDKLTERRVFLNTQLVLLQLKMRYIRSGIETLTGEKMALISVVDALVYLFTEVGYTCKQCKFYSTKPIEELVGVGQQIEELSEAERNRVERARQRAENIQNALRQGDETGFCLYRGANLPTVETGSCYSVWNLPGNDYWSASDNTEDGREDVLNKVKQRLDPRSR